MCKGLFSVVVIFLLGCASCFEPHGDTIDCLDAAGVEELQARYLADPDSTGREYAGKELCFDGLVDDILPSFGSIGVSVNIADQVGTLLRYDGAREPEKYGALAEWAERHRSGDSIRVTCTLSEFVLVEDAPYPLVIPALNNCNLAE